MKAFVTGSTGLLGSNLVYALIEQGYEVKALVRSPEKARKQFGDLPLQYIQGDMENVDAFAHELADCDILFHTAAYFREYFGKGDHWPMLEKINIHGTIQLLTEAEKQGIKKTIYVSSSTVIGRKYNGEAGDEADTAALETLDNLYARSKVLAEEAIADWRKTHQMPVVLILPSAMFGPRDAAPTSMGQLVVNFFNGELPIIPPGGFSCVDARDVATAMISAVEKGKDGERYIVNNQYYSIDEVLSILSNLTGRPKPAIKMPFALALVYAAVSELIGRITGKEPLATVNAIRTLGRRFEVKADKAKTELGATIRPMEATLRDEVQWFLANGYINNPTQVQLKTIPA